MDLQLAFGRVVVKVDYSEMLSVVVLAVFVAAKTVRWWDSFRVALKDDKSVVLMADVLDTLLVVCLVV
jgi:hypothetical protein